MLYYALLFFVIAVVAGLLGFKGVESGATKIAKIFFFIFIVLALAVVAATILGISLVFYRLPCQRILTAISEKSG